MAFRSRRVLRLITGLVALFVFAVLIWVLPAVYDSRYAASSSASTATTSAEAVWHEIPTPEQDAAYVQHTRTDAAFPGAQVEGRDGFLFLGDDYESNFAQAMGRRFYSPEEVQRTVDAVASRNRWLTDRHIASEFFVIPASWSIYPDKMPTWTDGAVLPHVLDQLRSADSTSFPDLRPALQQARSTADTYSRLNSHWTQYGAFVGFTAMVAQLQADHPEIGPLPLPALDGVSTVDGFNEMAQVTGAVGPNNWTVPQFGTPLGEFTVVAGDGSRSTVPGDQMLDITQMPLQTESNAGNHHRALILADSATTMLSPYLASAFGSTMMVRHWVDKPELSPNVPALVESYKPDVVLTLVSERNLNVLSPDFETSVAAVAYDDAGPADAGQPSAVGSWSADGEGFAMSIDGGNLADPVVIRLTAAPDRPVVARLDLDATAAGTLLVSGATGSGVVARTLRVAQGPNVLFVELPAGLADGTWNIQRSTGDGTWSLQSVTARAVK